MSASKDTLEYLFKAVGSDGKANNLTSIELDEIRALLNDRTLQT